MLMPDSPVIFFVHGLAGGVNSNYVQRIARQCQAAGWRVAALAYYRLDWGDPQDVKASVERIHERFPAAPIVGMAWSAGCHSLTRYLQTAGEDSLLTAAICNGGVYDFSHVYEKVSKGPYHPIINRWIQVCGQRHSEHYLSPEEQQAAAPLFKQHKKAMSFYTRFVHRLEQCSAVDENGDSCYMDVRGRVFPDDLAATEAEKEGGVVGEHFRGELSIYRLSLPPLSLSLVDQSSNYPCPMTWPLLLSSDYPYRGWQGTLGCGCI